MRPCCFLELSAGAHPRDRLGLRLLNVASAAAGGAPRPHLHLLSSKGFNGSMRGIKAFSPSPSCSISALGIVPVCLLPALNTCTIILNSCHTDLYHSHFPRRKILEKVIWVEMIVTGFDGKRQEYIESVKDKRHHVSLKINRHKVTLSKTSRLCLNS